MTTLMKCGCVAQGTSEGKPVCVVHMCHEVAENVPDLTGRMARCPYCSTEKPSALNLPFFEHKPGQVRDGFYCGCMGWD